MSQPVKPVYAKLQFIDGTTQIETLPVDEKVLTDSPAGAPHREEWKLDHWRIIQPLGDKTAPFAAITYAPENVTVGGFFLFVGVCRCESLGTTVRPDGWLVDEDGKGLLR